MILPLIYYGHPILRQAGAKIEEVTPFIRRLARDMIETMHSEHGAGLAAQQIGHAIQLAVVDVRGINQPSQLFVGVRETPLDSVMPWVLINPVITHGEGEEKGSEGCLSFPGLVTEVSRAGTVHVSAMGWDGQLLQFVTTGLLSRVVQHEIDHLNGVLFIDRMTTSVRKGLENELRLLKKKTLSTLKKERQ